MFAVRITRDFESLKSFFDKVIHKHPDSVLVVFQHDADDKVKRTHIHALMENVNPSTDTLKRWVKEVVGPVVKSDWSFKALQSRDLITYMSKGCLDPKLVHNITYEDVAAFREKWVEPQATARPVKEKREDATSYTMAEELAKWIDENSTRKRIYQDKFNKVLIDDDLTEREIVLQCVKIHNKYRKGFCDFSLIRVIQTAYGLCSHEKWRDTLVNKVLEKLSPRIV